MKTRWIAVIAWLVATTACYAGPSVVSPPGGAQGPPGPGAGPHASEHATAGTDPVIPASIGAAAETTGTSVLKGDGAGGTEAAVAADIINLWTACTGYLKSDGTCTSGVGSASALADQYIDWNASSGGASIANKPTLGDAATKNVGTAAGTVAAGNDSRFTTQTHSWTHSSGGSDPITPSAIGAITSSGNITGNAGGLTNQYINWSASSGGSSIANKPTLGTMSSQAASAVAVTGGTINGATVGATTPAAGTFTTLSAGAAGFTVDVSGNVAEASASVAKTSGTAGQLVLYQANSTDTYGVGWIGPSGRTTQSDLLFRLPDAAPTTGQTMLFGTPSAGVSAVTFGNPSMEAHTHAGTEITTVIPSALLYMVGRSTGGILPDTAGVTTGYVPKVQSDGSAGWGAESGGSGETVSVITGGQALSSGGTYLYTGTADAILTLPATGAGVGPITILNDTAYVIHLAPNAVSDVIEYVPGTSVTTAGHYADCTGDDCTGRWYAKTGKWKVLGGISGTWSDGASAFTTGFSPSPGSPFDFADTENGSTLDQIFTITNSGTSALNVTGVSMLTGTEFSLVAGGTCVSASPIGASGTCTETVRFAPSSAADDKTDTARFVTTELGNQDIVVTGDGTVAGLSPFSCAADDLFCCGWETGSGILNTSPSGNEQAWDGGGGSFSVVTDVYYQGAKAITGNIYSAFVVDYCGNVVTGCGGTLHVFTAFEIDSDTLPSGNKTALFGASTPNRYDYSMLHLKNVGGTRYLVPTCRGNEVGDTGEWITPSIGTGTWYQAEVVWESGVQCKAKIWDADGNQVYPTSGWKTYSTADTMTNSATLVGGMVGLNVTIHADAVKTRTGDIGPFDH